MIYPDGRKVFYSYQGLDATIGRVSSVSDQDGAAAGSPIEQYSYLGLNTVIGKTRPQENVTETIVPDTYGRVASVQWTNGSSTTDSFAYTYDNVGDVLTSQNLNAFASQRYGYDGLHRMNSFLQAPLSTTTGGTTWQLDSEGNKFDGVDSSGNTIAGKYGSNYSGNNHKDSGYNPNGNERAVNLSLSTSAVLTYDAWGRVVSASGGYTAYNQDSTPYFQPVEIHTYKYDALGRQISDTTASSPPTINRSFYDGQNVIEERDGATGNLTAQYIWSAAGPNSLVLRDSQSAYDLPDGAAIIPQVNGAGNTLAGRLYAQDDRRENIVSITDQNGAVVERYLYDQDGMPKAKNAIWGTPAGGDATTNALDTRYNWVYLWHGGRYAEFSLRSDTRQGLYTLTAGASWYDPVHGAMVQPDYSGYIQEPSVTPYTPTAGADHYGGWYSYIPIIGPAINFGKAYSDGEGIDAACFLYQTGFDALTLGVGSILRGGLKAVAEFSIEGVAKAVTERALGLGSVDGLASLGSRVASNAAIGAGLGGAQGAAIGYEMGGWQGALEGAAQGAVSGALTGSFFGLLHWMANPTCFAAGTELLVPKDKDGGHDYKRIEDFRPGMLIWTRNEFDPEAACVISCVEEVFTGKAKTLAVTVDSHVIRTTAAHRFYVCGKGWTQAASLASGDLFLGHDRKWSTILEVRETGEFELVYNVRVAGYHTYFVSGEEWGFSVWAHNIYQLSGVEREELAAQYRDSVLSGTKMEWDGLSTRQQRYVKDLAYELHGVEALTGPRRGDSDAHNAMILQVANEINASGYGAVVAGGRLPGLHEVELDTAGGFLNTRRPDMIVKLNDGTRYGINVGLEESPGVPVLREREALADLNGPGNLPTVFVSYGLRSQFR